MLGPAAGQTKGAARADFYMRRWSDLHPPGCSVCRHGKFTRKDPVSTAMDRRSCLFQSNQATSLLNSTSAIAMPLRATPATSLLGVGAQSRMSAPPITSDASGCNGLGRDELEAVMHVARAERSNRKKRRGLKPA